MGSDLLESIITLARLPCCLFHQGVLWHSCMQPRVLAKVLSMSLLVIPIAHYQSEVWFRGPGVILGPHRQ